MKNTPASELTIEENLLKKPLIPEHFFAEHLNDEFQIKRENGQPQGIFKVWAPNIIPSLEHNTMEKWAKELEQKPLALFQCLEEWREKTRIFDTRLQKIFKERDKEIPKNPEDLFVELFLRMEAAFKLAAPFYNIEALVADNRKNSTGNPIKKDEKEKEGGELDLVALALPSALNQLITAQPETWQETSWEGFKEALSILRQKLHDNCISETEKQVFITICRIADRAGISPIEVLFAANAMEFIPSRVAGKKNDLPWQEAISIIQDKLKTELEKPNTTQIAREINARIRFLNWVPAKISKDNFKGEFWNYGAVCDTSSQLFKLILEKTTSILQPKFQPTFLKELAPQLQELDANSARGRMILGLMSEGKFQNQIAEKIDKKRKTFQDEILSKLQEIQDSEALIPLEKCTSTLLVGGKARGLQQAKDIINSEHVMGGNVLTSEAINNWLNQIPKFSDLQKQLLNTTDPNEKIIIGQQIIKLIKNADLPPHLLEKISNSSTNQHKLVFRSSCFDEDVELIGPAPGIYESALNIDPKDQKGISQAIKEVVISFFDEKAISFRELKGIRHKPFMAILIQEFVPNSGGTVFCENGIAKINVASRPDQIHHTNKNFEEIEVQTNQDTESTTQSQILTKQQLKNLQKTAFLAAEIYGPVDIEFVIDPKTNLIKLLQMRKLAKNTSEETSNNSEKNSTQKTEVRLNSLEELNNLQITEPVTMHLNKNIDIEKFQGALFIWLMKNRNHIKEIALDNPIPMTCHFANIISGLNIKLTIKANHANTN